MIGCLLVIGGAGLLSLGLAVVLTAAERLPAVIPVRSGDRPVLVGHPSVSPPAANAP